MFFILHSEVIGPKFKLYIGYATSHRLKWGPLSPNCVSKIIEHIREGGERNEGKPTCTGACSPWSHGLRPNKCDASVVVPPATAQILC